jgi:hypothetical protein
MIKKISLNKRLETDFYVVTDVGFQYLEINEQHPEFFYPSITDRNPAGWFSYDAQNMVRGDFNGDGFEDAAFILAVMPHVVDRNTPSIPAIFLNNGRGNLSSANDIIDGEIPKRHMLYRSAAADFNRDGRDDLLMSVMGLIERDPNEPGGARTTWEPIAYLISGEDGKLRDATRLIEGQEEGGMPEGFSFGHDLAVGDFDGDGWIDAFTGKVLLLNNGDGSLRNRTDLLPAVLKKSTNFIMSSAAGDLNNDGVDDLIVSYSSPEERYALLSTKAGLRDSKLVKLPEGSYGEYNTKSNFISTGDLNGDGLVDIVIAETRSDPYYLGQHIQILINKGDNTFSDETSLRIDNSPYDKHHGEGELFIVDVNNDNCLDIVHSTGVTWTPEAGGLDVFINRGNGFFLHVPTEFFPAIDNTDISGFEQTYRNDRIGHALPINLNNSDGIDFVSLKQLPLTEWPQQTPNSYFTYSLISKKSIDELPFGSDYISLDQDGFAGQAYRIYKAAFDRTPDTTGLGYWIAQMDKGMDVVEVAARFIDSPEFRQLYGSNVSDATFITNIYNNVLDRNPDDVGLAWWVNEMKMNPSKTWQKVLADFSESAENKANIASLIANGIAYDPWE